MFKDLEHEVFGLVDVQDYILKFDFHLDMYFLQGYIVTGMDCCVWYAAAMQDGSESGSVDVGFRCVANSSIGHRTCGSFKQMGTLFRSPYNKAISIVCWSLLWGLLCLETPMCCQAGHMDACKAS